MVEVVSAVVAVVGMVLVDFTEEVVFLPFPPLFLRSCRYCCHYRNVMSIVMHSYVTYYPILFSSSSSSLCSLLFSSFVVSCWLLSYSCHTVYHHDCVLC